MAKQNDYVTKSHFDESINKLEVKFNMVMEKLDWLIGKYRNHEEEHTLLNGKVSEHSDRLEIIEKKVGITV